MSVQTQGANEAPTCHGGLENLEQEYSYALTEVEGKIPSNLKGNGSFFSRHSMNSLVTPTEILNPVRDVPSFLAVINCSMSG